MLEAAKRDIAERFFNWETFNGFFLFIPWGAGFIWYGLPSKELLLQYSIWHERFGYNYGMVSLGMVLLIWGVRKVAVNRVHQQIMFEEKKRKCRRVMEKQGKI